MRLTLKQIQGYLFSRLIQALYVSGIFSHIHNVRYVEVHVPIFGYISVVSGMFRIPAQLDIFMYIEAYSEPVVYSGIFRTTNIFSQFQARYSGITQEPFMHILNLN